MRIAIIGAGIVGVTTAYELSAEGHEVTVYERRSGVAAEASFANAGLVAPGYVTPWAAPGMPMKVLRQLASRHAAVRLHPSLDLVWGWKWWRACRADRHQANRLRMQRLATFSRERLDRLTERLRLEYERRQGYLVLLRSRKDLAMVEPGLATLSKLGTRFELIDAARCRVVEPGLAANTPLHAGIHLPDEVVGNCRQFAMLLRKEAAQLGTRFQFETQVLRLEPGAHPHVVATRAPRRVDTAAVSAFAEVGSGPPTPAAGDWSDTEPLGAEPSNEAYDAVVVCAALGAPALLRPHGLRLPMQAVHGYSVTAPLRHDADLSQGPRAALMDERYKVAITRLGARVRIAGSAELGGVADRHDPRALATLYKVLDDWFPGVARVKDAQHWKGARPMLPDGPPVLGPSGLAGIWLNLGHGSSGWALACGSARVLADSVAGRTPPLDVDGLGIERLRD
jgi:D-amino-acid dehydrogenase